MKINHKRIFLHSLRSALLFAAGFIIYDILVRLEKIWNIQNPENATSNFLTHKVLKFILIFIMDLLILYGISILFGIEF